MWRARRLLPFVAAAWLPACDEAAAPGGSPSTFDVYVYVELDDAVGMGAADLPVAATVTVTSNAGDLVLVDSTGADGHAGFDDIPSGGYIISHVATARTAELELRGSAVQTVVAPFGGGTVETQFIYGFAPGVLTGVAYRDDNESGSFESGLDSVFAAVPVLVYAGPDTTGTAAATGASGSDGLFDLGQLEPGDYTLLVRPRVGTAVVGGNPRPVTIAAGDTTFHEIEFVGEPVDS